MMPDFNQLKKISIFQGLSEQTLKEFFNYFNMKTMEIGTVIFKEKTMGDTLPPLNKKRAACESNIEKWQLAHSSRTGRFRKHNRGGFVILPDRPSLSSVFTLGRTAGAGALLVGEAASIANAINAPYQIDSYGEVLNNSIYMYRPHITN